MGLGVKCELWDLGVLGCKERLTSSEFRLLVDCIFWAKVCSQGSYRISADGLSSSKPFIVCSNNKFLSSEVTNAKLPREVYEDQ